MGTLDLTGAGAAKPAEAGGPVNQYKVTPGRTYYYHYVGGGHDNWLRVRVTKVEEVSKGVLWFTERFAHVVYETGMTGMLPLDTGCIFEDLGGV